MIADSQTGTRFSSSVGYITEDGRATEVETRNVFNEGDPKRAAREMQVTADLRERVEKPVYSLSIGYHPEEEISDEEMLEDMEELLKRRGLGEHQAVLATHRDKPHPHVHATVNRVHPGTRELWRDSFERLKNMDTLREIEKERGRISPRDAVSEEESEQRGRVADWKLRRFDRTGEVPFGQEVQAQVGDVFAEAETWEELQTDLAAQGLHVEKKGSGGVVTDGQEEAPLSEVARAWSFNKLDERFPDEFRPHETYERAEERTAGPSGRGDREAAGGGEGPPRDQARDRGAERQGRDNSGGPGRDRGGSGGDQGQSENGREEGRAGGEDHAGAGKGSGDDRGGRRGGREGEEGDQGVAVEGEGRAGGMAHGGFDPDDLDPLEYSGAEPLRPPSGVEDERAGAGGSQGAFEDQAGGGEHERGGAGDVQGAGERESGGGEDQPERIDSRRLSEDQLKVAEPLDRALRAASEASRSASREAAAKAWGELTEEDQEELEDLLPERGLEQLRRAIEPRKAGGRTRARIEGRIEGGEGGREPAAWTSMSRIRCIEFLNTKEVRDVPIRRGDSLQLSRP